MYPSVCVQCRTCLEDFIMVCRAVLSTSLAFQNLRTGTVPSNPNLTLTPTVYSSDQHFRNPVPWQ